MLAKIRNIFFDPQYDLPHFINLAEIFNMQQNACHSGDMIQFKSQTMFLQLKQKRAVHEWNLVKWVIRALLHNLHDPSCMVDD